MNASQRNELARRADAAQALAPLLGPILPAHGVLPNGECTCANVRCDRPGKHPARRNYKAMATTDPALLHSYWRLIQYNLALLIPAWLVVVDIDLVTIMRTLAGYAKWPPTPTVITRRGVQMHYRWPLDGDSPSVGGLDRLPLDVKGTGELATLPPSTGRDAFRYRWRDNESPHDIPIAPLPLRVAHRVRVIAQRRKTRVKTNLDLTTLSGARELGRRRGKYASLTSNGVNRGKSGLLHTLADANTPQHLVEEALAVFMSEAGR